MAVYADKHFTKYEALNIECELGLKMGLTSNFQRQNTQIGNTVSNFIYQNDLCFTFMLQQD